MAQVIHLGSRRSSLGMNACRLLVRLRRIATEPASRALVRYLDRTGKVVVCSHPVVYQRVHDRGGSFTLLGALLFTKRGFELGESLVASSSSALVRTQAGAFESDHMNWLAGQKGELRVEQLEQLFAHGGVVSEDEVRRTLLRFSKVEFRSETSPRLVADW